MAEALRKNSSVIPKIDFSGLSKYSLYFILLFLALSELTVGLLYLPNLVNQVIALRQRVDEKQTDVKNYETAVSLLRSIDSTQLSANLKKINTVLPKEKRIAGLVTGFINLASSSGMAVTGLEFSPGRIASASGNLLNSEHPDLSNVHEVDFGSGVKGIVMYLSITGNAPQLTRFLRSLQTSSPLIGVKNVEFTVAADQAVQSKASLQLLIFYQPEVVFDITDIGKISDLSQNQQDVLNRAIKERKSIIL